MVAAITAIGAVVGLAAMLVMSNRYSSALVNYGFSQGDIGKAMITFANTRSATRGIIGFDEQGLLDDLVLANVIIALRTESKVRELLRNRWGCSNDERGKGTLPADFR